MGVDRNTNNTNNTNSSNGDAKDGNNLKQQQQQQHSAKATIQLVKDMIEITDEDQNNNNNNSNNCDLLNDSQTTSDPSSEGSTPIKDLPSEQSQKQKNVEDSKSRTKSPCHISTLSSKAKNLKLNTAKALQQQQEQAQQQQQQNVPANKSKQQHQQQSQTLSNHEYLAQLLKDKRQLLSFPSSFSHVHRILDNEINRVRITLLHQNSEEGRLELPEPEGEMVTLAKKLFVPQKDYPEFNFVGRILGPRGMTAKQLEQDTGCKIMIRGKGSMRDKTKEEMYRGKPNWEHLDEELHVLITVEDSENRASLKLERAVKDVQKLLVPSAEGEDSLKKLQLMELAIINGTYRDLGRQHLNGQMAQIIPMTSAVSGLTSPQVCVSGSTLIGQPGSQHPPPTPTLVTTPVLLTPRIAPYFPPPGVLTRTSMMNPGQQGAGYSVDLQHYDRQQHQQQQQTSTGLVFQIDPNYVAFHHSPFLEFALFGNNRQAPKNQGQKKEP